MHRFYIAPECWNPDALILRDGEAHHARDVLRMKRGDRAVVFNGRGREITAEIVDLAKEEVLLRRLTETEAARLRCRITLGQAIPKGKNMDLIVQKAVEIGASEIAPVISERTVVDLDNKEAQSKREKWQHVAIEAAKQCGQNWLPSVHGPRNMKDFFGAAAGLSPASFDLRLIGSLQPDAVHLKRILTEFTEQHGGERPTSVLMMVGPE